MTPVSMVPHEQGPRQAADLVAQLQLSQTGQQVWRFKPAPGPEGLQAQGGVPAQGGKQRVLNGLGETCAKLRSGIPGYDEVRDEHEGPGRPEGDDTLD